MPRKQALDDLAALRGLSAELREAAERRRLEDEQRRQAELRAQRENNVFRDAVADATPLRPSDRAELPRPQPVPAPRQRELDDRAVLDESMSDEIDIERLLDTDEALSYQRSGIGPDVVRRLRRGEWTVQRQIDLHGLRVDEAREALAAFLALAVRDQQRCVRVIHGKGLGSIGREPRRLTPRALLSTPPRAVSRDRRTIRLTALSC